MGNLSTPISVQKLQTALHAKAKAEAGYRFYALYDKIYREDVLAHAYAQCRSNKGAPGVDRQDFAEVEAYGVSKWLGELALALRQETYRPAPIRRVFIPKANGKLRPLGISTLRDRVCMTAAMLVLEPIFEADLPQEQYAYRAGRNAQQAVIEVEERLHRGQTDLADYFGSIPHAELMLSLARRIVDRRVLHLIKMWLECPVEETDNRGRKKRTTEARDSRRGIPQGSPISPLLANIYMRRFVLAWKRLGLQRSLGSRIADQRFLALLWKFIKAGCVDRGLFRAASEGVPQGGVISPLLSNIMLHEFDVWMEKNYLNKKARKDRWAWNFAILKQRPIAVRENRQWKPAVAYCRYADDFVIVVKGTREHAEAVREACRGFLEGELKLTLNMEKTHITHVNDGFVFLGHRIIRKRGARGRMRPVTTIPWEKYRGFAGRLVQQLSGNYGMNRMDLMESLNRQIAGWAAFYQYTDFTATMFRKLDRTVFWKFGYWLARRYRRGFRSLMRDHIRAPEPGQAATWVLQGQNSRGWYGAVALRRLVTSRKGQFRWRTPSENPYIMRDEARSTIESRYADVAFAMSNA